MLESYGNTAQRGGKGEKCRSKQFEISFALYLGTQCSSPQILFIVPFCKLVLTLCFHGQKIVTKSETSPLTFSVTPALNLPLLEPEPRRSKNLNAVIAYCAVFRCLYFAPHAWSPRQGEVILSENKQHCCLTLCLLETVNRT